MMTSQSCLRYVGLHHALLTELLLTSPFIPPFVDTNGINLHLSSYLHTVYYFLAIYVFMNIYKSAHTIVCIFVHVSLI